MMFGIIGGAFVYGFALYGLAKFLLERKNQPDD
jgi:hypothetical protein